MNYDNAKYAFDELKNLDGKISFKGENTLIDYFVLLPTATMEDFDIEDFLNQYTTSGSFEIEGNHDESYTIIAINAVDKVYNNDTDYFQRMLVGG